MSISLTFYGRHCLLAAQFSIVFPKKFYLLYFFVFLYFYISLFLYFSISVFQYFCISVFLLAGFRLVDCFPYWHKCPCGLAAIWRHIEGYGLGNTITGPMNPGTARTRRASHIGSRLPTCQRHNFAPPPLYITITSEPIMGLN